MTSFKKPLVDLDNPLYCPNVSASQFVSGVRLFQASIEDPTRFSYFHRLCLSFEDTELGENSPQCDSPKHPSNLPRTLYSGGADIVKYPANKVKKEQEEQEDKNMPGLLANSKRSYNLKRHLDTLTSNSSGVLHANLPKKFKRSSSQDLLSFVLSTKADRLHFSDEWDSNSSSRGGQDPAASLAEELFWPDGGSKIAPSKKHEESKPGAANEALRNLKDDLLGPDLGPETPGSINLIVKRIESFLPGVRLKSQLDMASATHQDIVNILGIKGHLNPKILSLFRKANVCSLNLTESMVDADGLNLLGCDTLKVLKCPNSFQKLKKLVLSDARLSNNDLTKLGDLSCLETLFLDDTQIGDEAIMHLVALKHSLVHLELSWNRQITDDAIPSLCALTLLSFLSLKETSVTAKGLRKLACSVKEGGRKISLILPSACEVYFCNLDAEYETNVTAPLIQEPLLCATLSSAELRANLIAHAAKNALISTKGTKDELQKRLRKLLERRRKDVVVREFLVEGFA
ncbi:hypothetical protein M0805_002359 [Coniferiporia weirii]|nr:hypothetical protein M0805_002359 [Coniferiporia weirii]